MTALRVIGLLVIALAFASALPTNRALGDDAVANPREGWYRAVVPGISSDATSPTEAPHVSLVIGPLTQRVDGGLVITGEVVNAGQVAATNVEIEISIERSGRVATAVVQPLVPIVAPGKASPFRAYFAGPTVEAAVATAAVLGYEETLSTPPTATFVVTGPYPFQIGPPDPKTGVIPYSSVIEQLHGTITNTSDAPMARIEVIVVAYGENGEVLFVTTGLIVSVPFQEPGTEPVLAPGRTGGFVAGVPMGLLLKLPGEVRLAAFLASWTSGE